MKAIIENANIYKVTGEKGDFYVCEDNKGKLKMFAKHQVNVVEIEDMPKANVYKKVISSKEVIERSHKQYLSRMREAEFQEKYLECQRGSKY